MRTDARVLISSRYGLINNNNNGIDPPLLMCYVITSLTSHFTTVMSEKANNKSIEN